VGQSPDRIEREGPEFRQRVADGYRIVAGKYADRVVLLDGTRPPDELHEEIRGHLREHF
jgi:thymidylate kinase